MSVYSACVLKLPQAVTSSGLERETLNMRFYFSDYENIQPFIKLWMWSIKILVL